MTPEIFKLAMPDRFLVFVIAPVDERLNAIGQAIRSLGGMVVDSQLFAISTASVTPESLRDALGELEQGERVYLVSADGDSLESRVLVRPKTEGGIVVGA